MSSNVSQVPQVSQVPPQLRQTGPTFPLLAPRFQCPEQAAIVDGLVRLMLQYNEFEYVQIRQMVNDYFYNVRAAFHPNVATPPTCFIQQLLLADIDRLHCSTQVNEIPNLLQRLASYFDLVTDNHGVRGAAATLANMSSGASSSSSYSSGSVDNV